jgi:DNA modification methylase
VKAPYLDDGDVRLYLGDCVEVMAAMPAESVDAVVCDPPYGLEFMGKEWDRADSPDAFAAWCETWAREALRVLKPGGHLLAFGGTRTFHRLTCGIEDAGFEVRDCLSWLYGSGFPKSLDVSKAIDKAAGAEREVLGPTVAGAQVESTGRYGAWGDGITPTAPATDAAREWQGWGTALKPGWEPCVVARKPLAGTVAENVQAHGTGALNVDGCRIGMSDEDAEFIRKTARPNTAGAEHIGAVMNRPPTPTVNVHGQGRWPANVVLDEQAAAMLDAQSGTSSSKAAAMPLPMRPGFAGSRFGGDGATGDVTVRGFTDTGGASRFFYTAKASRADRSTNGANNTHPTVKPTDLMRWLVRLVTPPGGVVLDPFAGSGSTLVAARAEGVRCIGIEREEEYARIIADRLSQLSLLSEGMVEE